MQRFDVDVSERGKQLSLGMRAVSFLGAFALAASVYYFFYQTWGIISTPLQIGISGGRAHSDPVLDRRSRTAGTDLATSP